MIACDLSGNRIVFLLIGAVKAGNSTVCGLNSRVKKPAKSALDLLFVCGQLFRVASGSMRDLLHSCSLIVLACTPVRVFRQLASLALMLWFLAAPASFLLRATPGASCEMKCCRAKGTSCHHDHAGSERKWLSNASCQSSCGYAASATETAFLFTARTGIAHVHASAPVTRFPRNGFVPQRLEARTIFGRPPPALLPL